MKRPSHRSHGPVRPRRFILIDHSLEKVGGHNYEYAIHIGQAAEQHGMDVVLAAHQRFQPHGKLPQNWSVRPLFPFNSFNRFCLYKSGQLWNSRANLHRSYELIPRWYDAWREYRGKRLLSQFASACQRLLREVALEEGDVVFVPTLSEFDLLGLTQYLKETPDTRKAVWLLQFHFDLLEGRTPEYAAQQPRIDALRVHFHAALHELADHRIALLSTTARMAEQYNRLGLATFHELAYPVSPAFCPPQVATQHISPVRIALAGHFRREKGRHLLGETIERLWGNVLSVGRGQLMIQGTTSRIRRWLPPTTRARISVVGRRDADRLAPLVAVDHPLPPDEYANYIRQAGVGLFLYDSRRYFARCSGILVEMLASGVPVIVPAGCWLAEQVAGPIYDYQENLEYRLPVVGRTTGTSLALSGQDRPATVELPIPAGAAGLLVRFRCQRPWPSGTYVRIASHVSGSIEAVRSLASIVGPRCDGERVPVWIPLLPGARELQLRWANAYDQRRVTLCDVQFRFLGRANGCSTAVCPQSAVGLVAAEPQDVPRLIDEMLTHYEHYRDTAAQFAMNWKEKHAPRHVLQQLLRFADEALPLSLQLHAAADDECLRRKPA